MLVTDNPQWITDQEAAVLLSMTLLALRDHAVHAGWAVRILDGRRRYLRSQVTGQADR